MKTVSVSIPEYTIDKQPDYIVIGTKIDNVLTENFEGEFLARVISLIDHPKYNLDQLVNVIAESGTDKYDPNRKGVAHIEFEPYKLDLQAEQIIIHDGKLHKPFGQRLVKLFYENTLIDRGFRLRVDLILLYDFRQMVKAEKVDNTKPGVCSNLEKYLWRFQDPKNKQRALVGIVKILN